MTTGLILPLAEYGPLPGLTSSYPHEREAAIGPYGVEDQVGREPGLTDRSNHPIVESPRYHGGHVLRSFSDDYFNTMYLLPSSINLGSVTDVTQKTFYIWNARFRGARLTHAVSMHSEGVALSGPPTPTDFARMGMKTYTLTVYPDGPATIDARFTFYFDNPNAFGRMALLASLDSPPDPVELHLMGSLAELWMLRPNWSQRYDETLEFLTDIFTSRSGKEQRRALRNTPRRTVSFQSIAYGEELRWFSRMMAGRQGYTFLMPDLPRSIYMTDAVGVGESEVQVSQIPYWVEPGFPVVLEYGNQRTSRLIDTYTVRTISFTTPLTENWPSGTKIYPGMPGRLARQIRSTRPTNAAATIDVSFDVTPAVMKYQIGAAETHWRGTEVFLLKPNYANPINVTNDWPVENVDFNRGVIKTFRPIDFDTRTYQATYLGIGLDKVQKIIDVFMRAKGRRGEFYMPTWENDLPLRESLTQGSFRMRVVGNGPARVLNGDTVMKNLAVFTRDGRVYFNRVSFISEQTDADGTDSVFTCEYAWTTTILLSEVLLVTWMPLCRFASDGITVSWLTDEVANITLSITSLEDKASDQEL